MKIYALKKKEWIYILGMFLAGLAFIFTLHYLIPEKLRFPIATIFFVALFSSFFFYVKPLHFFELMLALWLVLIPMICLVVVLFHVIITFDIVQTKTILRIFFSIGMIIAESLTAGVIYYLANKLKNN